jgi:GxxExxY protein
VLYRSFTKNSNSIVDIKADEHVTPIHKAQLLTYLRMGAWKAGLLISFNVLVLREGIVRRVLGLDEERD